MKSPLTVFVCSTFADLSEEREAVLDAIRRLQLQHDSMEFFGARAGQPLETCLEEVRKSHIMVVIVGHRYGSLVPDLDISYSEAEYTEGYSLKKPCLVYMRDENVPVLPKHIERDPEKIILLDRWKATLQKRHTVATFTEGASLAVQVAADLSRTMTELEEVAEARQAAAPQSAASIADQVNELIGNAIAKGVSESTLLTAIRRSLSDAIAEVETVPATVFLSYANPDREIVRAFADGLMNAGVSVWYDEMSLKPGDDWVREIERGLDAADFVVFFISPHSVTRGWAQRELQVALNRQVSGEGRTVLLPILLEHAETPPLLRNIQWLDMTDKNVQRGVARLLETMQHFTKKRLVDGSRGGEDVA